MNIVVPKKQTAAAKSASKNPKSAALNLLNGSEILIIIVNPTDAVKSVAIVDSSLVL